MKEGDDTDWNRVEYVMCFVGVFESSLVVTCCLLALSPCSAYLSLEEVDDVSSGCGESFSVVVVSNIFEGKPILQRHRCV